jgi:hypothetical protein
VSDTDSLVECLLVVSLGEAEGDTYMYVHVNVFVCV